MMKLNKQKKTEPIKLLREVYVNEYNTLKKKEDALLKQVESIEHAKIYEQQLLKLIDSLEKITFHFNEVQKELNEELSKKTSNSDLIDIEFCERHISELEQIADYINNIRKNIVNLYNKIDYTKIREQDTLISDIESENFKREKTFFKEFSQRIEDIGASLEISQSEISQAKYSISQIRIAQKQPQEQKRKIGFHQ